MKRLSFFIWAIPFVQSLSIQATELAIERSKPSLSPMPRDPRFLSLYPPFHALNNPRCEIRDAIACLRGSAGVDDTSAIISAAHPVSGQTKFAKLPPQCLEGGNYVGQHTTGPFVISITRGGVMDIEQWLPGNTYKAVHLDGLCWNRY